MDEIHRPFVRKLDTFTPLPMEDKIALAAIESSSQSVPPNTDLIRDGDRPVGMIVVAEGYACRYKLRRDGRRQIVAYLLPGDVCDFDALDLGRMDHAIGTFSMCRISRIGADVVRDLHRRPAVAQALQAAARVDEATMRAWLVNLGRRSAVERLAHLFCELFVRLRAVGLAEGNNFVLPVMQHDLADTTGMTTVHINRTLGALKKAGLIVRKSKHLTILDLPRLMAFAEFEPHYLRLKEQTPEQGRTLLDGGISSSVAEVQVPA